MRADLRELVRGRLGMEPDHVLIYNNYDLTEGSILLFLFRGHESSPFAVIKLGRSRSPLLREYENLKFIQEIFPGIATAPLFFDEVADYHALCTEPLPANRLTGRDARFQNLQRITEKIAELHVLLKAQSDSSDFSPEEFLEPFSALHDTELSARTVSYFSELAERHARLLGEHKVPKVPQHGDLYFDNILVRGSRVYFLDWEDFGDIQLPGYDLFSLVFDLYGLQEVDAVTAREDMSRIADRTSGYFRTMDIPVEATGALMLFTLVQQYSRSRMQGRTSTKMFARRLEVVAENTGLLERMIDAYTR